MISLLRRASRSVPPRTRSQASQATVSHVRLLRHGHGGAVDGSSDGHGRGKLAVGRVETCLDEVLAFGERLTLRSGEGVDETGLSSLKALPPLSLADLFALPFPILVPPKTAVLSRFFLLPSQAMALLQEIFKSLFDARHEYLR